MSQYNSRLYVAIQNVEDWKKLYDIDFKSLGFWCNPFDGHTNPVFEINVDWSCFEDELLDIVEQIAERIPDCIIFADTNNINVDPYNFIVYYLGEQVMSDEIEGEMQWETYLNEPIDWFSAHNIELSDEQRKYLKTFGFE